MRDFVHRPSRCRGVLIFIRHCFYLDAVFCQTRSIGYLLAILSSNKCEFRVDPTSPNIMSTSSLDHVVPRSHGCLAFFFIRTRFQRVLGWWIVNYPAMQCYPATDVRSIDQLVSSSLRHDTNAGCFQTTAASRTNDWTGSKPSQWGELV